VNRLTPIKPTMAVADKDLAKIYMEPSVVAGSQTGVQEGRAGRSGALLPGEQGRPTIASEMLLRLTRFAPGSPGQEKARRLA
jgi:hypothetical protein